MHAVLVQFRQRFVALFPRGFAFLAVALLLTGTARAQNGPTASLSSGSVGDAGARPSPRDPGVVLGARNPFGNSALGNSGPRVRLLPVFFPPTAPVLGAELPPAPAVRDSIWTELMPFTNEVFYAQLGTRFFENELNRRLRPRLDVYRNTRTAALAELRTALESGSGAVSALAARQDEPLKALDLQADDLRRELYQGGFLASGADWSEHRNWRLGDTDTKRTPQELLYDEYTVMRAAIYYQEGLSMEQRQLLREITIELAEALGERDGLAFPDSFDPEPVIFFLPHGSRLRVPTGLPAALSDDLAAFTAAKTALRTELRDELFHLDKESDKARERALQELAAKQAPRFAALEPLAERIRTQLAGLPNPVRATGPAGLSPELASRIDRYLREKAELQRAAQKQAQASGGKSDPTASRATLAEFETANRARLAALATEARAIRDEVARVASANNGGQPKSVDALLSDFMGAFKQQQLQSLYNDYRTAVLLPGLSPPQRRLLFDAALAALDLPGIKDWWDPLESTCRHASLSIL